MKKPSNLKMKEVVKTKRSKGFPSDFEDRKKKYAELKELRQKIKLRKTEKEDKVFKT
jgi:hypothetical protein